MASGSFPLDRCDPDATNLLAAAALIELVCNKWVDAVYSGESGGLQYDNTAADGAALAKLRLAERLAREQVQKEQPHD